MIMIREIPLDSVPVRDQIKTMPSSKEFGEFRVRRGCQKHLVPAETLPTKELNSEHLKKTFSPNSVFSHASLPPFSPLSFCVVFKDAELERIAITARPGTSIRTAFTPRPSTTARRRSLTAFGAQATSSTCIGQERGRARSTAAHRPLHTASSLLGRPSTGMVSKH